MMRSTNPLTFAAETLALAERQLVDDVDLRRVRHVTFVAAVADQRVVAAQATGTRLRRVAKHIAGLEMAGLQTERRRNSKRHRVVQRVGRVLDDVGAAEQVRIGEDEVRRQTGSQSRVSRDAASASSASTAAYGLGLKRASGFRKVALRKFAERVQRGVAGAIAADAVEVGEEDRQR